MVKILLVQRKRLGDVLLTTPLIRGIKAAFPEAVVHYAVEEPFTPALEGNPGVSCLVPLAASVGYGRLLAAAARLRREKYDAALDLMGHPKSAALVGLSGARRRIGFSRPLLGAAYDVSLPRPSSPEYVPAQKLRLLEPLGIPPAGLLPEFHPSPADRAFARGFLEKAGGPAVVLLPASRRPARRWPPEFFAAAADGARSRFGLRSLVVWGPGEKEEAERIADLSGGSALVAPPTGLGQAAALLERSAAAVAVNNGLMHLAVAVGAPVVGLFGATDPRDWAPAVPSFRALTAPVECLFCGRAECRELECMRQVTPAMVLGALAELFSEVPGK